MSATSGNPTASGQHTGHESRRLEPDSSVVEQFAARPIDGRPEHEAALDPGADRRLTPRQPPGRKTRKARAYASEILRLREAGYPLDGIRDALADVGVKVSSSTVHREAMRPTNEPGQARVVDTPRGEARDDTHTACNQPPSTHP